MLGSSDDRPVVSGIGVVSAVAQGQRDFTTALLRGTSAFGVMSRPGRQATGPDPSRFLGAEIANLSLPDGMPIRLLRNCSLSTQAALATLQEAWLDARLDAIDPHRIGLIVGGSNFQQRELVLVYDAYGGRPQYVKPSYGMSYFDSDLCGACSQHFGIRGFAHTVGAASASGQIAVIQAAQAVRSGEVDVCIALGALADISYWECYALRSMGAMGTDLHRDEPSAACRPFDKHRDGFIYGESCGAVVVERRAHADRPGVAPYAAILGSAVVMDANRRPNADRDGEVKAIGRALACSGLRAADIDYVNPHGSGSVSGDETELSALQECGLRNARINATKSIIGHGISSAGVVELIATLLQIRSGRLHPTLNLLEPIRPDFNWVRTEAESFNIEHALNLSYGFGGVNTALCVQAC